MPLHMKGRRLEGIPQAVRGELVAVRHKRGWSQAELGQRVGLPQMHISGIETGKIVPRFDTLLELVRVLDRDLLMIPRELVPAVQALLRDRDQGSEGDERPLYAVDSETDQADET